MIVSLHEGRKGSLPPCKAAAILGSPVEGERTGGSRCGERSAVTASQLLPRNFHLEPVGEILVIVGSISGPVGIGGTVTTSGETLCCDNRRLIGTPLIVIARQSQKNRD